MLNILDSHFGCTSLIFVVLHIIIILIQYKLPIQVLFLILNIFFYFQEINLDLVQFPKPVLISEIRIIPLGARVQADFPGGVRLGATNPSQFHIEFFVNDLSKPHAATFESLGALEYRQNVDIQFECNQRVSICW